MANGNVLGRLLGAGLNTGLTLGLSELLAPDTDFNAGELSNAFVTDTQNPFIRTSLRGGNLRTRLARQPRNLIASARRRGLRSSRRLGGLIEEVEPGESRLLDARLREIENARQQAVGDLRGNLASRRLLGSSFATNAITRANLDAAELREEAAAESFLQSLDRRAELINRQFETDINTLNAQLEPLINAGTLSADLASNLNRALAVAAGIKADLAAKSAAGIGNILGGEGGLLDVGTDVLGKTLGAGLNAAIQGNDVGSAILDSLGLGGGGTAATTGGGAAANATTTAGGNLAPPSAQPSLGGGGPAPGGGAPPTPSGGGAATAGGGGGAGGSTGFGGQAANEAAATAQGGPPPESVTGGGGSDTLSGGTGADTLGAGGVGGGAAGAAASSAGNFAQGVAGGFPGGTMGPSGIALGEGAAGIAVPAAAALVFGKVLHGMLTASDETPNFRIKIGPEGASLGGGAKDVPPAALQGLLPVIEGINQRIAAGETPEESQLSFQFVPGKGIVVKTQRARSAPGGQGDPENFQSSEVSEQLTDLTLDQLVNLPFAGLPTDPGQFGTRGQNLRTTNTGRPLSERTESPTRRTLGAGFTTVRGRGGTTRRVRETPGR